MRAPIAIPLTLSTLLAALALGCRPPSPPPLPPLPPRAFSAELAWEHLRALVEIGPRPTGSEGAAKARDYIRGELEKLGIESEVEPATYQGGSEEQSVVVENIWGVVPGTSEDLIVLLAPYDTRHFESFRFVGANDGGSGAALLLELARVIAADPLPYTTSLGFLDGESHPGGPEFGRRRGLLGSTAAALDFQHQGLDRRIRLLLVFNQVGDADLRIARDLRSHRLYREQFWRTANRLGYVDEFPAAAHFESPKMSHLPFVERRMLRVVAIGDTAFGGEEPPGIYANTEDDALEHCSPESFQVVGEVTLEALDAITRRLAKIDRFSKAPLSEVAEPDALEPEEPVSDEAAEAPEEPELEAPEAPAPDSGEASTPEAEDAPAEAGEAQPAPSETEEPAAEPAEAVAP